MRHSLLLATLLCLAQTASAAPSFTAAELRSMAGRRELPALEAGNTASTPNDFASCVKEMVDMAESAMEWGYPVQQLVVGAEERRQVLWVGDGALVLACHATERRAEATFLRYAGGSPGGVTWTAPTQGERK